MDWFSALQNAVAKVCEVDPATVTLDSTLEDLGIDSLAVAEIIVELEVGLDRELPVHLLRQLDGVRTVGDVVSALELALPDPTQV